MPYQIHAQGFDGQKIEVQPRGFFSGTKLLVNGTPAPRGKKRGEMVVRANDGREVIATWKPRFLGLDVPQLVLDGKVLQLVEPLRAYEMLWSALPVILVFVGGALGAIVGLAGLSMNARVFRSRLHRVAKYAVTAAISLATAVCYVVLVTIFLALIGQ